MYKLYYKECYLIFFKLVKNKNKLELLDWNFNLIKVEEVEIDELNLCN